MMHQNTYAEIVKAAKEGFQYLVVPNDDYDFGRIKRKLSGNHKRIDMLVSQGYEIVNAYQYCDRRHGDHALISWKDYNPPSSSIYEEYFNSAASLKCHFSVEKQLETVLKRVDAGVSRFEGYLHSDVIKVLENDYAYSIELDKGCGCTRLREKNLSRQQVAKLIKYVDSAL